MKTSSMVVLSAALFFGAVGSAGPAATHSASSSAAVAHYASVKYEDAQWEKIVPGLGDDSPEIAILRVDPTTGATQLLIRNRRAMHVPRHWHSANETHTVLRGTMVFECDGQRDELGPGSFNYITAKMIHQAWLPADGLVFITVDAPWDINWVEGPPTAADLR